MKILLVNHNLISGVEYYRSIKPAIALANQYPEFDFTTCNYIHPTDDIELLSKEETEQKSKEFNQDKLVKADSEHTKIDDNFLKNFDLIIFTRELGTFEHVEGIAGRLRRLGIPFGVDTDDYWHLPENHLVYGHYQELRRSEGIELSMKLADFVICTTPILADEIKEINKNVYIIENGIDLQDEAWQPEYSKSELMRFGLMLGSTHFHDLKKAAPSINNMFRSMNKDYQFVLAGFNAEFGKPSIYVGMEKLITDNHNLLNPKYSFYLKHCKKESNELFINMPYVRRWSVPVQDWGYEYKHIDISIVPLVDNKFNNCKSELKMIEAGFKGKGVIVSNVKPYTLLATDKNSYLVNSSGEFYDKMKRALNNPSEVGDKIAQLREDVLKKHSLQVLNQKRKEFYEKYK